MPRLIALVNVLVILLPALVNAWISGSRNTVMTTAPTLTMVPRISVYSVMPWPPASSPAYSLDFAYFFISVSFLEPGALKRG